jgi:hypothetical protein
MLKNKKMVLQYSSVFSRSSLTEQCYFVKGSRRLFEDTYYGRSKAPDDWLKLIQTCRRLELPHQEYETSSPANPTQIIRNFPFLDGGLMSREGDYFYGIKGTWILGRQALRFVCYEVGVEQPRRFKGEESIPSHQTLLEAIVRQAEETPDELWIILQTLASK